MEADSLAVVEQELVIKDTLLNSGYDFSVYLLKQNMRKVIIFGTLIVCELFICFGFENKKENAFDNSKGVAVIELFTSEGCSSCPPAEAVMHKLIQKANTESLPVYILEFHVDYWDYLGWKDTFAMPMYSQRQQGYGYHFNLKSIYTPQAIINGKCEMIGSDDDKINAELTLELQNPSSVNIDCKVHTTGNSKIVADYNITGNIFGCELNLAVVESGLTTYIQNGENAHATLTHDNVVRVFKRVDLKSLTGQITIAVPHINLAHASLICFVQNNENRNIIAATRIAITQ